MYQTKTRARQTPTVMSSSTCNLCGKAHAAGAVDASGHHSLHERAQVLIVHRPLQLCEPASVAPKVHGLQTITISRVMNRARDHAHLTLTFRAHRSSHMPD